MITEYSQKDVIDVLLKSSEEFRAFHSDHKTTLDKLSIRWFENTCLANGVSKPLDKVTYKIDLNSIPPENEKAMVVAHELYHCILGYQGYPIASIQSRTYDPCITVFLGPLNSMVYDHYINEKLMVYFDNGCQLFKLISREYFDKNLKNRNNIGLASEILILFVYVNFRLNFDILCDSTDIQESKFFRWFIQNRPDLIMTANELVTLIKSANFDDPMDVTRLFQEIIKKIPSLESIRFIQM